MKYLPNLITLLNVLFGSIAAVFAVLNRLEWAAVFFMLGVLCDFADGLVARKLGVQSELGIQLDSLADMITSGLVPGLVMCQLLAMSVNAGWNADSFFAEALAQGGWWGAWFPFAGLLITLSSAVRLARFNIDENQVNSFIGLPTPANALWILSLPLILMYNGSEFTNSLILNPWFLSGLTLLSAYLLNAPIELFALKFDNYSFRDNSLKYIFIVLSLVMVLTLQFLAIPLIVLFYVLTSLFSKKAS
ncbi:CDP-alcohol phosphatidyltransferase family protein [Robiginitalea aurantiaca]|uniref:CDP-alcohol phosphatidyltransferase family protein n=1 Tax=Robiginitalea aurantiaca TaxID=3056915 RepID=A0ABT7WCU7_9FLAO|nr:CDP-alcohol phosphatidyltransferase family protein [Robiginitalea aurantiaca]MDM9630754.1 CDP-alcohol phosphatidyltransferase family protein [Robiginitalea aurantiaca]